MFVGGIGSDEDDNIVRGGRVRLKSITGESFLKD